MNFAQTYNITLTNSPRPPCIVCAESNVRRASIRAGAHLSQSSTPGEGWSVDKFGPLRTKALDGSRYFLLAIDDAARLARAWFLKTKTSSEDLECLKALFAWSLTQTGRRVKKLRSDGEWVSNEFKQFQATQGFEHLRTTRGTPSANAIVERHGGSLLSMARTMLINAKAPPFLFAEAFSYAVYVHNRLPRSTNQPPVVIFYGQAEVSSSLDCATSMRPNHRSSSPATPRHFSVHQLKVFGCKCVFRVDYRKPAKNEPRGIPGVFIGCDSNTRSWRIFVPSDRSIHLSRDVTFFESELWYHERAPEKTLIDPDNVLIDDSSLETASSDNLLILPNTSKSGQVEEMPTLRQPSIDTAETLPSPSTPVPQSFDPGIVRMDIDSCVRDSALLKKDSGSTSVFPPRRKRVRSVSPSLGQVTNSLSNTTSSSLNVQNNSNITQGPFSQTPLTVHASDTSLHDFIFAFSMPSSITVKEALKEKKWRAAMDRELNSLKRLDVYCVKPRKPGMNVIGTRWVFTEKTQQEAHGEPAERARFVGKGFQQRYGANFTETWAPTISINAVRVMVAIAAQFDYGIKHIDVRTAFLNAKLPESNIYVEPPEGYYGPDVVLHLHRALYGLKQSGREWYLTLSKTLISLGFTKSKSEPCLFFKHSSSSLTLIVTHVDDLLCAGTQVARSSFAAELSQVFKIKDAGPVAYALGIEFHRTSSGYRLTQTSYTTSLLSHFGFSNCHSSPTPMVTSQPADAKKTSLSDFKLNEIVGSLLWLSKTTRPDIAFATAILSQHVHAPTPVAYGMASRILRYLKGTVDYGITMNSHSQSSLELYADADWASDSSRKSHTGVIAFFGTAPIAWISKKQNSVALSSSEAELVAACEATTLAKFFLTLFQELPLPPQQPVTIYEDNSGAIHLANTSVRSKRLKHIDIRYQFINDEVAGGTVKLIKIASELNVADIFTKPLALPKFRSFLPRLIASSPSSASLVSSSSSSDALSSSSSHLSS